MFYGDTETIRKQLTADADFVISAARVNIYNAAGTKVVDDADGVFSLVADTTQIVSYLFTPPAVGRYTVVFTITVGTETRQLREIVDALPVLQDGYPTAEDLAERIRGLGIIDEDQLLALRLDTKISAAVTTWEQDTGHQPFLAAAADSTRTFDPPRTRKRLWLSCGLASLTSLTVTGAAMTEGVDFYTYPDNATAQGLPILGIEFTYPATGLPRCVAITGRWGYCTTLPEDAREAILTRALMLCHPELALGISAGLQGIKDATFATNYGAAPLSSELATWKQEYKAAVAGCKRYTV